MPTTVFLLAAAFVGSADAFNVAPRVPSRAAAMPRLVGSVALAAPVAVLQKPNSAFDCGCGGIGCGACLGPAAILESTQVAFDCGVCGGMGDWCPACRGPTTIIDLNDQASADFECSCGGMGDCPACRGPAP